MAFDAALLGALSASFRSCLTDGRIERIFQCTRDSFLFEIAARGEKHRLLISAGPSGGYTYLTATHPPHPDVPPMFCMLLRKHLSGGRIKEVRQCGFERVVEFSVEFSDAFGALKMRYLYLEAMGRNSNLILCDENRVILGALRILDLASSPDRPLITGVEYRLPKPKTGVIPFNDLTEESANALVDTFLPELPLERALMDAFSGIGPTLAAEIAYRVCKNENSANPGADLSTLPNELLRAKEDLKNGNYRFCAVFSGEDGERRIADFSCFDLIRFPGLEKRFFETPSELLDFVFTYRRESARLKALSERSRSILHAAIKRLKRKLAAQNADLEAAKRMDEYKLCGDLIMQNLHSIRFGVDCAELYDYEGKPVRIALDCRLSPSHNAQRYYDRYKKAKRALTLISEQLEATRAELEYAQGVLSDLDAARDATDLAEIAKEVSAWNYGKRFAKTTENAPKRKADRSGVPNFTRLVSPGGFPVLVGKNNLQNEFLTFHAAGKNDLWFHIKGKPGAHVILHLEGDTAPGEQDLSFAARCALTPNERLSGARVDYTRAKYVKHHPSGLPGRVVYTGEREIFVRETDRVFSLFS